MIVGFSVSSSIRNPSAWVAGRESDDAAGTLSFSQVQIAGNFPYSAFDGEPLRWGDYTGATVGPDGTSPALSSSSPCTVPAGSPLSRSAT